MSVWHGMVIAYVHVIGVLCVCVEQLGVVVVVLGSQPRVVSSIPTWALLL